MEILSKINGVLRVNDYLKKHKRATFWELRSACFMNNPAERIRLLRKQNGKKYILTKKLANGSSYYEYTGVIENDK